MFCNVSQRRFPGRSGIARCLVKQVNKSWWVFSGRGVDGASGLMIMNRDAALKPRQPLFNWVSISGLKQKLGLPVIRRGSNSSETTC
jgi:hypothetical protein